MAIYKEKQLVRFEHKHESIDEPQGDAFGGQTLLNATLQRGRYDNPLHDTQTIAFSTEPPSLVVDTSSNKVVTVRRDGDGQRLIQPSNDGQWRILSPVFKRVLAIGMDQIAVDTDTGIKVIASNELKPHEITIQLSSGIVDMSEPLSRLPWEATKQKREREIANTRAFLEREHVGNNGYGFPVNSTAQQFVVYGNYAPSPAVEPVPATDFFRSSRQVETKETPEQANKVFDLVTSEVQRIGRKDKTIRREIGRALMVGAGQAFAFQLPPVPQPKGLVRRVTVSKSETGRTQYDIQDFASDLTTPMPESGFTLVRDTSGTILRAADQQFDQPLSSERYTQSLNDAQTVLSDYFTQLRSGNVVPSQAVPQSIDALALSLNRSRSPWQWLMAKFHKGQF